VGKLLLLLGLVEVGLLLSGLLFYLFLQLGELGDHLRLKLADQLLDFLEIGFCINLVRDGLQVSEIRLRLKPDRSLSSHLFQALNYLLQLITLPVLNERKFLIGFNGRLFQDLKQFLQLAFVVLRSHGLAGNDKFVLVCFEVQRPNYILETQQVDLLVKDPLHILKIDLFGNHCIKLGFVGLTVEGLGNALLVRLLRELFIHLCKSKLNRLRKAC